MSLPVGGFTAIPNPIMIPFMQIQSYVMAVAFGSGFQYGKRKIAAMSNDDFNKLTSVKLLDEIGEDLKDSIPDMQQALQSMSPLVDTIVKELFNYLNELSRSVGGVLSGSGTFGAGAGATSQNPLDINSWFVPTGAEEMGGSGGIPSNMSPAQLYQWAQKTFGPNNIPVNIIDEQKKKQQENLAKINQSLINARQHTKPSVHEIIQNTPSRAGNAKPKAGQTQKLERARLVKLIDSQTQSLKIAQRQHALNKPRYDPSTLYNNITKTIAQAQRDLEALLNRYSW